METTIRIYVANLAAYNNGRLIGAWIDLPCADLDEQLQAVVDAFPEGDELAIHDFEAPFKINEYDNIQELNELAEKLEDDEDFTAKISYLLDDGCTIEQALSEVDDLDFYPGMSLEDLAENFVDEGLFGDIPDAIVNYLDYEKIARDLGMDYTETEAGCFRRS